MNRNQLHVIVHVGTLNDGEEHGWNGKCGLHCKVSLYFHPYSLKLSFNVFMIWLQMVPEIPGYYISVGEETC